MSSAEFDEETLKVASHEARLAILKILKDKKTASINDIAEILNKHRSTVNRHILKLVDVGLVERTEIFKGSFVYSLSPKGLALVEHVEKYGTMPEVKVRVIKEKKVLRYPTYWLRILAYGIPFFFIIVGVMGLVVKTGRPISFLSRIIWFVVFLLLSLVSLKIIKRITQ